MSSTFRCLSCGSQKTSKSRKRKSYYCSNLCYAKAYNLKKRNGSISMQVFFSSCGHCGALHCTRDNFHKNTFCSKKCSIANNNKKSYYKKHGAIQGVSKKVYFLNCTNCNTLVTRNKKHKYRFCSSECKHIYHSKNLTKGYVLRRIAENDNLTVSHFEHISNQLIELKRNTLKLKRKLKTNYHEEERSKSVSS